MIHIELTEEKIDLVRELEESYDSRHGASLVFTGRVREQNHGRKVVAVSYDAFPPLCRKTLREICEEAQAKTSYPLRFRIVHRMGRLTIGEASVVIAVGSPHRAEAYEASRYVIENLKTRVPIWKKETYSDGESEWLQGHALCGHSPEQAI